MTLSLWVWLQKLLFLRGSEGAKTFQGGHIVRKTVAVLLILLLGLLLTGVVSASTPVKGGVFRYGMTVNPRGMFNPILNTESYDGWIIDVVYDGLLKINATLQPEAVIAERWETSDDGLSLTFYLKQGVKFHDGVELTAKDVEYTYKTILHPHYTGVRFGNFRVLVGAEEFKKGEREDVPGIEIIDDYTIRFTTVRPHAPFITQFTYGILPYHLLKDIPVAELETADFNRNPIGAGPFKFVEFRTDQHVILDRFDAYHLGPANIDQVVFQKIATETSPINLRQGRVDFVGVSPEQYPEVIAIPHVDTYLHEALGYNYIAFNLRQDRLAELAVRQAMKTGFDRDTYVEIILEGFAIKANAPMPQASWAFTNEGINPYDYDPAKAAKMLADAGWVKGRDGVLAKGSERLELELIVPEGTRTTEQMALLFQQNMGDLGIKVNLTFMEFNAAVDRVDAREFDMFTMGWSLGVDPDPHGIWHSTSPWNDPGFENALSDELIDKGRAETDLEKRKAIYAEWQRVINQELPYIFLQYNVSIAAVNKRVKGIDTDPGPYGPLVARDKLHTLWLED